MPQYSNAEIQGLLVTLTDLGEQFRGNALVVTMTLEWLNDNGYLRKPLEEIKSLARSTDPVSSKKAASSYTPTRKNQLGRLLLAYARERSVVYGLTSEEACNIAGVNNGWRRVSDLKRTGYIDTIKGGNLFRPNAAGRDVEVLFITRHGLEAARALEALEKK